MLSWQSLFLDDWATYIITRKKERQTERNSSTKPPWTCFKKFQISSPYYLYISHLLKVHLIATIFLKYPPPPPPHFQEHDSAFSLPPLVGLDQHNYYNIRDGKRPRNTQNQKQEMVVVVKPRRRVWGHACIHMCMCKHAQRPTNAQTGTKTHNAPLKSTDIPCPYPPSCRKAGIANKPVVKPVVRTYQLWQLPGLGGWHRKRSVVFTAYVSFQPHYEFSTGCAQVLKSICGPWNNNGSFVPTTSCRKISLKGNDTQDKTRQDKKPLGTEQNSEHDVGRSVIKRLLTRLYLEP